MIEKSLDRIKWRFSQGKAFAPNENDINAYNEIIEFFNKQQKKQFDSSYLFGKLYIYIYMKILEQDRSTVFDTSARRKLSNLLRKPIEQIIGDLKDSLNESELYYRMKAIGFTQKHPALQTDEDVAKDAEIAKELLKDPKTVDALVEEVWDYETVKEAVIAEVNFQINRQ